MNKKKLWTEIGVGFQQHKKLIPNWPDHVAAQAGIVSEASGRLMAACLEHKYKRIGAPSEVQLCKMKQEAIRTAVTAIRFLENMKEC